MDAALTASHIAALRADFAANRAHKAVQNALARTPLQDVALDHEIATSIDSSVSHHLDDWKVTNQKRSGRCWMFAGLNLLRPAAAKAMNVKDFEFSQAYTQFYDKLERANFTLENVIDLAGADADDRTLVHVLKTAIDDGGQWNMFVALIDKHGLVPKSAMPETHSSSHTAELNASLQTILRDGAVRLRDEAAAGADATALRKSKSEILETIHRVLCLHLGTPPQSFNWQWKDKDNVFHRDGVMTPREFADKYVKLPLDEYVCLVHDPRNEYGRTYTVDRLGNVVGGQPVVYLNVDIDVIRDLTAKSIQDGEPVWFGCDVAPQLHKKLGVWDANLFDTESLYGFAPTMDKKQRLLYQHTAMSHAMLFTGVNMLDGEPTHWRVENSWGNDNGEDGYYTMNDSWFGEFVFEIAARRENLPADLAAQLDTDPIVLPAWDPMGSLAS
ncbi:aminopeptidase C [Stackebrandtia nassauensis]|uniref:Aminopeptidase n=1 Tax=Stackebrandtia nassauensis (strain DSM 44728 / CIP 108903 / NRRL B-16338 / NBRC 102104 / LLR-40K-21) TaxID=446470 RepID=D3PZN0_STANL|nr:C1 family peptidase [Stackebrandtia nassauensis]ADD43567.1 Bleomycin hydrolase [Stackebrandtia nassauensis DSM 44728]